jgi:aspartate racemase
MKTIGLVGGITWVSTIDYYRLLNQGVNAQLGDLNFCKCIVYSVNFQEIQTNNRTNNWEGTFEIMLNASQHLVNAGVEAIVLCANTMHHIADRLQSILSVPLIHIAEVTADAIVARGCKRVALLGTRYTMELDFFKDKLLARGITPMIPNDEDREFVHQSIYNELAYNIVKPETKARYQVIIEKMATEGAEGAILGCTEIPLLIQQGDVSIPTFDTTHIHAAAAVRFALG